MRRLSEQSLGNAALHYLRRYSASRKGLAQVLERKVKRHVREKGGELDAARPMIEAVVERMVKAGYVDDARLAESKAQSLHRQGKSVRVVRLKLRQKGIDAETISHATQANAQSEREAADNLVRRKKLGRDPLRAKKDLGVLMRAGFSYGVAKEALNAAGSAGYFTVPT